MNCSTPGLPVHHQLPESTQTHVHWVSDAIPPYYPLTSHPHLPAPAFNLSQIRVFPNESALCLRWPKYSASVSVLLMNIHSWLAWSPCSPRDSQESSPTPQFKSINSSALSFLYGPTFTSIHDYLKNHSFDSAVGIQIYKCLSMQLCLLITASLPCAPPPLSEGCSCQCLLPESISPQGIFVITSADFIHSIQTYCRKSSALVS